MPRDPVTMRNAIAQIDELIVLELVPDVPKDGVLRTTVREKWYSYRPSAGNYDFVVILRDGTERLFSLHMVDPALWPPGTRAPR
jgi:hypothetical protein